MRAKICFLSALVLSAGVTLQSQDRILGVINDAPKVTLAASVPPAVAQAVSSSPVDPAFPMTGMILTLQPTAAQQVALAQLIAQQSDPKSPNFHKFLTPAQFAASFGASQNDIDRVTAWLAAQGFQVQRVMPSRLAIIFSGNATQVRGAFSTEIRQYTLNGETHHANATPAQIPSSLAAVGAALVKLHDFHSKPNSIRLATARPDATYGSTHDLAPADFATIYDLNPLYNAGVDGTGQTIALIGRSDVLLTDIASFRSQFGLQANVPAIVQAGVSDPGVTNDGDSLEATLDVEWAGAVAPQAAIKLVVAASTATADGVDLASEYAVNNNVAPVISVSFGSCEAITNNQFYNQLWQQAAAQGITVLVSAGDSGAAGCQDATASNGTAKAINGLCSSPYSTCVGGTEFNEGTNAGQYWLTGNNSVMGSAISYIPEKVWNESAIVPGGSNLYAGGGGTSTVYAKPAWQSGIGVAANAQQRTVPDLSLTAAAHDGYLLIYNGSLSTVSGTSASAPSMAGIMTLVNQHNGAQGLANPNFYALATLQAAGGPATFHDIVVGNNSVPDVLGFVAGTGYDEASGLGSVDGAIFVNNWNSAANTFTLTSSGSVNAGPSQNGVATITATATGTFQANLALSLSAMPSGVTAAFNPASISGGTGSSSLIFTVARTALSGTYPVTVTATGAGITKTVSFDVIVTVPTACTLTAAPTGLAIVQGQGSTLSLSCLNAEGAFPAPLALSATGMVSGMTVSFLPATLAAGTGLSKLTVSTTPAVAAGTYTLAVTATLPHASPAFSQNINVPVSVATPNTFTLTPSVSSVSMAQGATATFSFTSAPSGSFNAAISFSLSGLPPGVSGTLSAASAAAPGNGTITVALRSAITTATGTYSALVTGISGGLICTTPVNLIITAAPTFIFTGSQNTLTVRNGAAAATITLTVGSLANGFNSAVTFAAAGLPTGVTAAFTPASLAAPGSGTTVLSLSAASTATTGVATISLTATGGTLVRTVLLQITVTPTPTFTLRTSLPSGNVAAGSLVTETISATGLYGYNSSITLSTGVLPGGISVVFATPTISGYDGSANVTIQTAVGTTPGTYSIVVTGTDSVNNITQTVTLSLLIGTVTTTLSPTTVSLIRGGPAAVTTVTTVAQYYPGTVILYVSGALPGFGYSLGNSSIPGSGTTTLTVYATTTVLPGTYTLLLHAYTGAVFTVTPLTVVVTN